MYISINSLLPFQAIQLSAAGGFTLVGLTRRVIFRLLDPRLAARYSLHRRREKKKLLDSPLWKVILRAVMIRSNDTTEHGVEQCAQNVLKHANDRF